jgi:hypothetical protein
MIFPGDLPEITRSGDILPSRFALGSSRLSSGVADMKYVLTYGILAGVIAVSVLTASIVLVGAHWLWFGYLVMLVALTLIFLGVKRYRDVEKGGVIRFLPAFGVGLSMAIVAGVAYVLVWEAYEAATHYAFMDQYIASIRHAREAAGVTGPALAREMAELDSMRVQYANPLFRIPMVFLEIFPVGLLVALVSAALLRNPRFLRSAA